MRLRGSGNIGSGSHGLAVSEVGGAGSGTMGACWACPVGL
jgi:hypothetical protein